MIGLGMQRGYQGVLWEKRNAYFNLPCPTSITPFAWFTAIDHCEMLDNPACENRSLGDFTSTVADLRTPRG